MSARGSSSDDSGGCAALIGLCLLAALVVWIVEQVVAGVKAVPVPVWVLIFICVGAWVWCHLHLARTDPLRVRVMRGDDRVVFTLQRRMWARPFPGEAVKDESVVISPDGRTAQVRRFDPKTEDESRLADCLSETQDTAAWWTYRMRGGADDVDKAVVIASKLAERNLSTKGRAATTWLRSPTTG